jgi:hypothetical protein
VPTNCHYANVLASAHSKGGWHFRFSIHIASTITDIR